MNESKLALAHSFSLSLSLSLSRSKSAPPIVCDLPPCFVFHYANAFQRQSDSNSTEQQVVIHAIK